MVSMRRTLSALRVGIDRSVRLEPHLAACINRPVNYHQHPQSISRFWSRVPALIVVCIGLDVKKTQQH